MSGTNLSEIVKVEGSVNNSVVGSYTLTYKSTYNGENNASTACDFSTTGKICTSGTNCNDTVTRTTTWEGLVGLIYTSDYGFASTNISCRTNLNDSVNYSCNSDNWLHKKSNY